ncbi:MAG: NAD-dependent epimerase/dehydratase family protein [Coriobacteriales bacterium]|nr:NAD-dependent epimerase/dehydratase family protein [Coriobacteriales bacterium]
MGVRYNEDVERLAADERIAWGMLDGSRVVITGATGLIGGLLARVLMRRNQRCDTQTSVVLPVRNVPKARAAFGADSNVHIVSWDASLGEVPALQGCDYVVHCASNTDSRLMVERPVDTITTTVAGTQAMLELARAHGARMCFVSSMEVYGSGDAGKLDESRGGELDAMSVRSSYPQAKQLAETLCAAYASQYGVDVCVARLAQSFGPGIASTDRRVFAEFARCCLEGRDIALLTDGSKQNMYVYTADAVRALLMLAMRGERGLAYNVANEDTYCSIYHMAQMVAQTFGTTTQVTRVVDEDAARRYAVSGSIRMDVSRMRALGWEPDFSLTELYGRMIEDWDVTTAPAS